MGQEFFHIPQLDFEIKYALQLYEVIRALSQLTLKVNTAVSNEKHKNQLIRFSSLEFLASSNFRLFHLKLGNLSLVCKSLNENSSETAL